MKPLTEDETPARHGFERERPRGRSATATRGVWSERLTMIGVTAVLLASACAPVIRPPETPSGFFAPPRVTYSGVLTLDGGLVGADAPAAAAKSVPASLVIDTMNDDAAIVRIGAGCSLAATVTAPLYGNVLGHGYVRRPDGALSIGRSAACAIADGPAVSMTAGVVVIHAGGAIELVATGVDAGARPASVRFLGTRAAEEDVTPPQADVVEVHFLGELVTSCPVCTLNHRRLNQPGVFAFEPRLEQRLPINDWAPVCAAPCAARLDSHVQLRVGGLGLEPSAPFALPRDRRRVAVKASATGTADRVFGWSFLGAGSIFVGLGAAEIVAGAIEGKRTSGHRDELGGALFTLSSLAFIIPGLLVLGHQQTTITTDAGP